MHLADSLAVLALVIAPVAADAIVSSTFFAATSNRLVARNVMPVNLVSSRLARRNESPALVRRGQSDTWHKYSYNPFGIVPPRRQPPLTDLAHFTWYRSEVVPYLEKVQRMLKSDLRYFNLEPPPDTPPDSFRSVGLLAKWQKSYNQAVRKKKADQKRVVLPPLYLPSRKKPQDSRSKRGDSHRTSTSSDHGSHGMEPMGH